MCRPLLASLATREQAAQAPLRKLAKSPSVRSMNMFMSENARIQVERNLMFKKHLESKQQIAHQLAQQKDVARAEKIRYVQQLAQECGVDEGNK